MLICDKGMRKKKEQRIEFPSFDPTWEVEEREMEAMALT
jgi:hypothetical protein